MQKSKVKSQLLLISCPCCQSKLWIDPVTQEVIQFEKDRGKKKKSLDELLLKEKKRKSEFDRKFEATTELEKERWKKAEEKFKKALTDAEMEE